ncbi:MAG: hypothetical protein M1822_000237 [Bathelium mastoideum]|nr:MAG: hypothetical protein M1822_000237 [Bathelium mastoideum]
MAQHLNIDSVRVDCIEWVPENAAWRRRRPTVKDILQTDVFSQPGIHIFVFPEIAKIEKLWNHGKNRDPLCNQLSNKFRIPQFFWSRLGWDANGFFRPQANTVSGERIVRSYTSTFRFLLKQVKLTTKPGPVRSMTGTATLPDGGETLDYDWEYYGLHSVWTQLKGSQPGSNRYCQVLLCFDLVAEMRRRVLDAFEASDGNLTSASPFGVHNVFLEPLIEQYDTALWGFRIPVRKYEKVVFSRLR